MKQNLNYKFIGSQVMESINSTQQNVNRNNLILSKYKAGFTLQEIGEEFNISRERARQIIDKTLGADLNLSKNINPNLLIAIEKRKHNKQRLINRWGLKRYRFRKAIQGRLEKIDHQFFLLTNYSNNNIYEYTEEEINKIFSEIDRKVKETKEKFHFPKNKDLKL